MSRRQLVRQRARLSVMRPKWHPGEHAIHQHWQIIKVGWPMRREWQCAPLVQTRIPGYVIAFGRIMCSASMKTKAVMAVTEHQIKWQRPV